MARVDEVDYKDLAIKARDIRNSAKALNVEFTKVYEEVIALHQSWYGKRYNSLANDFNNLAPNVNEITKLTYREIPFALETVANNFSIADEHIKTTNAQETQEVKMKTVPTPNDVGMRFMESSVNETKTKVNAGFKRALEEMNKIDSIYNKVTWRSESAEAFRAKFTKIKNDITNQINNIQVQFDKLMQQAINDIQQTEKNNTVS